MMLQLGIKEKGSEKKATVEEICGKKKEGNSHRENDIWS